MSPGNADSFQACVSIGRPASALAPATLPTLSGRGPQAFSSAPIAARQRLCLDLEAANWWLNTGIARPTTRKERSLPTQTTQEHHYKETTVNNKQHIVNRLPPDCRTPRVAPYKVEKGTFGDIGLTWGF